LVLVEGLLKENSKDASPENQTLDQIASAAPHIVYEQMKKCTFTSGFYSVPDQN